jgi:hypothetical protein
MTWKKDEKEEDEPRANNTTPTLTRKNNNTKRKDKTNNSRRSRTYNAVDGARNRNSNRTSLNHIHDHNARDIEDFWAKIDDRQRMNNRIDAKIRRRLNLREDTEGEKNYRIHLYNKACEESSKTLRAEASNKALNDKSINDNSPPRIDKIHLPTAANTITKTSKQITNDLFKELWGNIFPGGEVQTEEEIIDYADEDEAHSESAKTKEENCTKQAPATNNKPKEGGKGKPSEKKVMRKQRQGEKRQRTLQGAAKTKHLPTPPRSNARL